MPSHSIHLTSHHCQFVRFWVVVFHFIDFLSSHTNIDIQGWEQNKYHRDLPDLLVEGPWGFFIIKFYLLWKGQFKLQASLCQHSLSHPEMARSIFKIKDLLITISKQENNYAVCSECVILEPTIFPLYWHSFLLCLLFSFQTNTVGLGTYCWYRWFCFEPVILLCT